MKKMLKVLLCLSAGLFFMSQNCNAGIKVHGNVSDTEGDAITGAALTVKGTTKGVTSNVDGNYTFNERDNITKTNYIICSSIGYKTQEKKAKECLNFVLKEDGGWWDELIDLLKTTAAVAEIAVTVGKTVK